ncbi:MAG: AbrB/MazE/SpoVT family DNA-binding domain-containing protein [Verrucomicrobiaceae bacterium]|nr:AbrB/MazE/SpoVT family DNA-binding domain-containing protein [Verrucomicrobiaceae bacterium]
MTATLTIDESGQITLPETLRRVFGGQPGARVRAEVTADRIEIVKEVPLAEATAISASGRVVLAPTGMVMDAGKAVREEREALVNRAASR